MKGLAGGNGNCVRIMRSAYVHTCRGRFQAFPGQNRRQRGDSTAGHQYGRG
jgi:hypothetical protein